MRESVNAPRGGLQGCFLGANLDRQGGMDEMADRDEDTGRFLPGNRIWEGRENIGGRSKRFETPEDLWAAAVEYFEWCHDNPLQEAKAFAYEGKVTVASLPKLRAMTIKGLCLFLDLSEKTWRHWRLEGGPYHRPDLAEAIEKIEAVIYTTKFEGAAAGLLEHQIIARELGLAEKRQLGNDPDNPLPGPQVTIFALPDNGRG